WGRMTRLLQYIGQRLNSMQLPHYATRQKLSPTSTRMNANPPIRKLGASEKLTPRVRPVQPRSPKSPSFSKCAFASPHFGFGLTYRSGYSRRIVPDTHCVEFTRIKSRLERRSS